MWSRRSGAANEEELDEIMDGDEGIINRRLPLNSYNHQVLVSDLVINAAGVIK